MKKALPTWAVVATVDEPAVLIAAFVRHHLALGACEVHVFLDRVIPEVGPLVAGIRGCVLTQCDATYWAKSRFKKRPPHHLARQKYNATQAYGQTDCDRLLHCDADEFVVQPEALIADLATTIEAPHQTLHLSNSERVWLPVDPGLSIFEGGFRTPMWLFDDLAASLFGPAARYLNKGMMGHSMGKTLSPVGHDFEIGVHHALDRATGEPAMRRPSSARILYFDGLTRLHFILKMLKRAYETPNGPRPRKGHKRMAAVRAFREKAAEPAEIFALTRALKDFTPAQADLYRSLGCLEETPFVPRGCDGLDLCPASFDAQLRADHAAFFEHVGLRDWADEAFGGPL